MDADTLLANFETIAEAEGGVARLRELILQLAVQGKLVPQEPNDEPVRLGPLRTDSGKPGKGRGRKVRGKAPRAGGERVHAVPAAWKWAPLDALGSTQTGTTPKKHLHGYPGPRCPFIKPGDLKPAGVEYENESLPLAVAKSSGRTAPAQTVLMVGIGFGLQNIASNFISGLILLFERPIQVGDFVEVKGALGTVKGINARSTTVETQDNIAIIVPNSHFVSESVTNWSYRDSRTRIHIPIHVVYGAEVDRVEQLLLEVGRGHAEVLEEPSPRVQLREFGDYALQFELLVWIDQPTRQFFITSDLNFGIVRTLREAGIEIPVPQRDLRLRASVPLGVEKISPEER